MRDMTEALNVLIRDANREARLRGLATNDDMAEAVVAAGWKSPAEVAELVRAAKKLAWEVGGSQHVVWCRAVLADSNCPPPANPYAMPTLDTTEAPNGRNT